MSESLKTIIHCIRIWPWWLQPCQCFIKKNWHQKLFPILETYWRWEQGIHLIELLHSHANFQYAFAAFLLPSKVATHAYQNFEVYYLKTMTVCHFFFFFLISKWCITQQKLYTVTDWARPWAFINSGKLSDRNRYSILYILSVLSENSPRIKRQTLKNGPIMGQPYKMYHAWHRQVFWL